MTDFELLNRVLTHIDPTASSLRLLRRNKRVLLGLPNDAYAALRTLQLYQPQRFLARRLLMVIRLLTRCGSHRRLLPEFLREDTQTSESQSFSPLAEAGTCGILLGSPEHLVRRAVASYRHGESWEVAKVSFGEDGARILAEEAQALTELEALSEGIPKMLGLYRAKGMTLMRMPFLTGEPIPIGDSDSAIRLLNQWVANRDPQPITDFSKWGAICSALSGLSGGRRVIEDLSAQTLRPVICHGDFARWNLLRQPDETLMVMDWEWGHRDGVPGIDLVHYFLQDARLVDRLQPIDALLKTAKTLNAPNCRGYLERTGWSGDAVLPIVACLAYKQGSGHQANEEILKVAIAEYCSKAKVKDSRKTTDLTNHVR